MDIANKPFFGKVLFVCSAARKGHCTEAIAEQARGLKKRGADVTFFYVEENGFRGYLKGVFRLRRFLKQHYFDVVHAHYGLSAIMASLSGAWPLVVSLMGSDVFGSRWLFRIVKIYSEFFWPCVIVKSDLMFRRLGVGHAKIIPNGVDLSLFREISKEEARRKLGVSEKKIVLWPANPLREVKNAALAREVMRLLNGGEVELKIIFDVPIELMPWYYNAADAVLLTSRWEGSPNVVKEALGCNVPVISTPVGDVAYWLEGVDGCEICQPDALSIADALKRVLRSKSRIDGRQRIESLDIDKISDLLLYQYAGISSAIKG